MPAEPVELKGIAASHGIAIGPAYCYRPPDLRIPGRAALTPEEELARFAAAVEQADAELQALHDSLAGRALADEAAIFDAHHTILHDRALAKKVRQAVLGGAIVEQALVAAADEFAQRLAAMKNEMFAARAADVRDVSRRVLRILLGIPDSTLGGMTAPSVVVAEDLTPSDTASLNPSLTLGFCTAQGGLTSHSAILARTLGIPAVVGLGEALNAIAHDTPLILDGAAGRVLVEPDAAAVEQYRSRQEGEARRQSEMRVHALEPAQTRDGRRVEVAANVGDTASACAAVANGAEGVGLLRTEFLYLDELEPPSEEKQLKSYRDIFEVFGERPVIVRTLDIGGDKPPSYLPFPAEMNPFLGWRAVRISLDRPELFRAQVRAILRAAVGFNVRIMLPMVVDLVELRRARAAVEACKEELRSEGLEFAPDVPVGIMVETPAAAMLVDVLSEAADFFSLGTNDLTQYTLAVDRGNATVAALYQPLHPSVVRLIKRTIDLAHARGRWVGMCGELAGMRLAIPVLLGLGLDEFSMGPRAIPEAKHIIRSFGDREACALAERVLTLGTAAEIEQAAGAELQARGL